MNWDISVIKKSQEYILDEIKKSLPIRQHNPAPPYFHKFLNNRENAENLQYTSFRKNKNTNWYTFFTTYEDEETGDDTYLVCYVANNHTVAQHL